jgi:DNA-binding transcriptional regulator YiaG
MRKPSSKPTPPQTRQRSRTASKPTPLGTLRRSRAISQQILARLLRVSQQTYSKYESGVLVPPPVLQELAATILGGSRADLWPVDDERIAS